MEARVQSCLREINSILSPRNGPHLEIQLSTDPLVPSRAIGIESSDGFNEDNANSAHWSTNISCAVMAHEILHILGLVDLYEPEGEGFHVDEQTRALTHVRILTLSDSFSQPSADIPAYDCRRIGPRNLIMSNAQEAYASARETSGAVLSPAEVRAITLPACQSSNRVYFGCAAAAYRSTRLPLERPIGNCGDLPPECRSRGQVDWLLR